jgi:hypothetical protein
MPPADPVIPPPLDGSGSRADWYPDYDESE